MIKLTDEQLTVITRGVEPLHPRDRSDYLRAVAAELNGHEIGDGVVYRVAMPCQRKFWTPPLGKHAGKYR
jgi:hypothetical protein